MAGLPNYPASPGGNDDFIPGSVIQSSEFDGNFEHIRSFLNTQFVDDVVTGVGALSGDRIIDDTITAQQLAPGTITGAELGTDSVTGTQIAPDAVGASELADNAVDTAAIQDDAITTVKVLDGAITSAKLDAGTAYAVRVTDENVTFAAPNDTQSLDAAAIQTVSVVVTSTDGLTTYTEGVDYTLDHANGDITHVGAGAIVAPGSVLIDYWTDPGQNIADGSVTSPKFDANIVLPAATTATTQGVGDNDLSVATTAYVNNEIGARRPNNDLFVVQTGIVSSSNTSLVDIPGCILGLDPGTWLVIARFSSARFWLSSISATDHGLLNCTLRDGPQTTNYGDLQEKIPLNTTATSTWESPRQISTIITLGVATSVKMSGFTFPIAGTNFASGFRTDSGNGVLSTLRAIRLSA